ncbi:nucleoside 2-deoxyribosyltransferase [archaeon]|nr:nucleoside 2-deoxyribosyltransferase [archaeon]MBL7057438.1 nucleoside 2-deoxyribosyltransferase [Candidatus Woesearchaeota archaeon]
MGQSQGNDRMKIYFAASITGGRGDVHIYTDLIEHLKKHGEVLTEHVGDPELKEEGENHLTDQEIHDKDVEMIDSADVLIAEVTTISMGVGYEIGIASKDNMNILCLFRPNQGRILSRMIAGCQKLTYKEYHTLEEAKKIIDEYIKTIK